VLQSVHDSQILKKQKGDDIMAKYSTKEFGEIETVWKKIPTGGILLRENNGTVFLEQHFKDAEGEKHDVLFLFDEGITLNVRSDFYECLMEARRFEPEPSVPIYIQTIAERAKEEEEERNARRKQYEKMIKKSGTHPWNFFSEMH